LIIWNRDIIMSLKCATDKDLTMILDKKKSSFKPRHIGDFDFNQGRSTIAFLKSHYSFSTQDASYLLFIKQMAEDIRQISRVLREQLEGNTAFEMMIKRYRFEEKKDKHYVSDFYPYFILPRTPNGTTSANTLYGMSKPVTDNIYDMQETLLDKPYTGQCFISYGFVSYHPDEGHYEELSHTIAPHRIARFIQQFCDFYFKQYRDFTQMAMHFAQQNLFGNEIMDNHYFEAFSHYNHEHDILQRYHPDYQLDMMKANSHFMLLSGEDWKTWKQQPLVFHPSWTQVEFSQTGYAGEYRQSKKINRISSHLHIYDNIHRALHFLNHNRPLGHCLENMVILELYIKPEQTIYQTNLLHDEVYQGGVWNTLIKKVWHTSSYQPDTPTEITSWHHPGMPYAPSHHVKKSYI
jgi:hypothetical protein